MSLATKLKLAPSRLWSRLLSSTRRLQHTATPLPNAPEAAADPFTSQLQHRTEQELVSLLERQGRLRPAQVAEEQVAIQPVRAVRKLCALLQTPAHQYVFYEGCK
jgi:hypothetical protein